MKKRYSLKKDDVLKKHALFDIAFKNGIYYKGRYTLIIIYPYERRQVAFTVKKRKRNAVVRNRIRRILREIYRNNKDKFPEEIVIIHAKGFSLSVKYFDIESDILGLLDKIYENNQQYPHSFY